jgi:hypothetical protein
MSSVAFASFRWLDTLEKEFDKAFVDVDLMLNDLLNESENGDLVDDNVADFVDNSRDKIKLMSNAWAQLVHKSQTIFQINCKLEVSIVFTLTVLIFLTRIIRFICHKAQLVNARSEVVEAKAFKQASEKELEKLMIELHSAQLQFQKLKQSNSAPNSPNGASETSSTDVIQKRLEEELQKRFGSENEHMRVALLENELEVMRKDNLKLKDEIVELNSEIYGAKLAAKYLEKELAGRIQQIQLFGKNLKQDEHERLWNQLEAEIHLHRHKTVIRACRGKRLNKHKSKIVNSLSNGPPQQPQQSASATACCGESLLERLKKSKELNQLRTVKLKRNDPKEGLGISITGGSEHGVPILVSEIHPDGPAARSDQLLIGDAILSANGADLKDLMHSEAVRVLSNLAGDVELKVYFVQTDEDNDFETNSLSDLNYPFLDESDSTHRTTLIHSSKNSSLNDNQSIKSNLSLLADKTAESLQLSDNKTNDTNSSGTKQHAKNSNDFNK